MRKGSVLGGASASKITSNADSITITIPRSAVATTSNADGDKAEVKTDAKVETKAEEPSLLIPLASAFGVGFLSSLIARKYNKNGIVFGLIGGTVGYFVAKHLTKD